MLWLGFENFLKISSVEDLVSNASAFRGGAFGNGLDCEGSNLINGLIYLMGYWKVVES